MQLKALFFLFIPWLLLAACGKERTEFVKPANPACELQSIEDEYIVVDTRGSYYLLHHRPLASDQHIKWYEPNYRVSVEDRINRRIEIRDGQPVLTVLSNEQIWQQLGVVEFWRQNFYGQDVSVAVVDTGVADSPYLEGRWFYNTNEMEAGANGVNLDDDQNGYTDDLIGWNFVTASPENYDEWNHGTQMAHIIAGSKDTPSGSGIAPKSIILPIDFMGENGGDEISAVSALKYAVARGVKIINNSWVTPCSKLLRDTLQSFSAYNVLIVNSAGNQGRFLTEELSFSSNVSGKNIVNVGSLDKAGNRSSFSNYGAYINFYAPGEGLLTFWGPRISEGSGTSFSAAIVSGAAALLWSKYPELSAEEIKGQLLRMAQPAFADESSFSLRLQTGQY